MTIQFGREIFKDLQAVETHEWLGKSSQGPTPPIYPAARQGPHLTIDSVTSWSPKDLAHVCKTMTAIKGL